MINLFVDTNIFLNFYSFEGDRLDQLNRLIDAVDSGNIRLHLPQQVINEISRNREQKIKIANEQFSKEAMQTAIPRHIQAYAQSVDYLAALETAKDLRKKLVNLAVADASNHSLQPDLLLDQLFAKTLKHDENEDAFATAIQRMQKGNPPGKVGSLGDQYNWEILLREVPAADLYIVSRDGDYVSLLNKSLPHPFLKAEWKCKKGYDLHIFSELKIFLDRYEQILEQPVSVLPPPVAVRQPTVNYEVIEEDLDLGLVGVSEPQSQYSSSEDDIDEQVDLHDLYAEKVAAIDELVDSRSFVQTHAAIAKLKYYRDIFNRSDAERMINAAVKNEQISWIATDSDVYSFFATLLTDYPTIESRLFYEAVDVFGLEPEPANPFDD